MADAPFAPSHVVRLRAHGNTLVITIPASLCRLFQWEEGDQLSLMAGPKIVTVSRAENALACPRPGHRT